jgi:hypothetical protein
MTTDEIMALAEDFAATGSTAKYYSVRAALRTAIEALQADATRLDFLESIGGDFTMCAPNTAGPGTDATKDLWLIEWDRNPNRDGFGMKEAWAPTVRTAIDAAMSLDAPARVFGGER